VTHPSQRLWAEVVRVSSHLPWSLDTVLDLEHPVRREVLRQLDPDPATSRRPTVGSE
jgi:hypothetical protein